MPGTPHNGGTGTCWGSGASWPDYSVSYKVDVNNSIPLSWVNPIDNSANAWTNVVPSNFNLTQSLLSTNLIDKGPVDKPQDWIAITNIYASPTTITKVTTTFDETDSFDVVSTSNSYDVQNVMTHEFGHWLQLKDISTPGCEHVTMWHSIAPPQSGGETKKTSLEIPDIEGVNWQYP